MTNFKIRIMELRIPTSDLINKLDIELFDRLLTANDSRDSRKVESSRSRIDKAYTEIGRYATSRIELKRLKQKLGFLQEEPLDSSKQYVNQLLQTGYSARN